MSDNTGDTTRHFDTRGPGGATTGGAPTPHPTNAAGPAVTRDYYLNVADGRHYAVEKAGWEPRRALGPLAPAELAKDVASHDWSDAGPAVNATRWNVRWLVRVCPREKELILSGRGRRAVFLRRTSLNFKEAILNADVADPSVPLEGAPPPASAVTRQREAGGG